MSIHKILTIGERKRAEGRDYYDLVYLMSKNILPDISFLKQKLNITKGDEIKTYLLGAVSKQNISLLQKDLLPFLFHQHDDSISNFDIYLKNYNFT